MKLKAKTILHIATMMYSKQQRRLKNIMQLCAERRIYHTYTYSRRICVRKNKLIDHNRTIDLFSFF